MTKPAHDFKLWISTNAQYYWVYYDGNREALVTSETYKTEDGARRGLQNFIDEMKNYTS
jgi:uncharacterized protein YegP (UPF0339 family)